MKASQKMVCVFHKSNQYYITFRKIWQFSMGIVVHYKNVATGTNIQYLNDSEINIFTRNWNYSCSSEHSPWAQQTVFNIQYIIWPAQKQTRMMCMEKLNNFSFVVFQKNNNLLCKMLKCLSCLYRNINNW